MVTPHGCPNQSNQIGSNLISFVQVNSAGWFLQSVMLLISSNRSFLLICPSISSNRSVRIVYPVRSIQIPSNQYGFSWYYRSRPIDPSLVILPMNVSHRLCVDSPFVLPIESTFLLGLRHPIDPFNWFVQSISPDHWYYSIDLIDWFYLISFLISLHDNSSHGCWSYPWLGSIQSILPNRFVPSHLQPIQLVYP
jgi:hypothetical protein